MIGEFFLKRPFLLKVVIMLVAVGILINDEKAVAGAKYSLLAEQNLSQINLNQQHPGVSSFPAFNLKGGYANDRLSSNVS